MKKLGESQGKVEEREKEWLGALEKVVGVLKEWVGRKEAKW